MKKPNVCPYALRQWSSQHQYKPGCKAATTEYCSADKDCALRDSEIKYRADIALGRVKDEQTKVLRGTK